MGDEVYHMNTLIERVQATYKRFRPSAEHSCEGLEVKTIFYGRPVTKEELKERRENIVNYEF